MPQKAMPACPVPEHSSSEEDVQKKADKLLKIFIVLWIMKKDILQQERKNQTLFLEPFESASKEE